MQIFILGDDYQIPTHFSSNSDMTSLLGHLSYVTFWVKFKWGMVRCYLAILGDKGYFCIPRMKWIFCHYAKPFFETVVLLGQAEANDLMPGTTTCISNLAYRFLLCKHIKHIKFAWNKTYCQESIQPTILCCHLEGKTQGQAGGGYKRQNTTCRS